VAVNLGSAASYVESPSFLSLLLPIWRAIEQPSHSLQFGRSNIILIAPEPTSMIFIAAIWNHVN
jgi:hypothetical protein